MKILFTGDVHAEWAGLSSVLSSLKPDITICAGDFGFWPGLYSEIRLPIGGELTTLIRKIWHEDYTKGPIGLHTYGSKIYFCDGNHENHALLQKLAKQHEYQIFELSPEIYYCPRGSILDLEGVKFLFVGGALSIDKHLREEGIDWFPEEELSDEDVERAIKRAREYGPIDVVVSHTAPFDFLVFSRPEKIKDPTAFRLSRILEEVKPRYWYTGHHHVYKTGIFHNTKWTVLSCAGKKNWYELRDLEEFKKS